MNYTLDTTIKELYDQGFISVRTFNSLNYAEMETLGIIWNYIKEPIDLLRLRNFGRKSLAEIEPILNNVKLNTGVKVPTIKERLFLSLGEDLVKTITAAHTTVTEGDTKVKAYLKEVYPHPSDMHELVMGELDNMLVIVEGFSPDEIIEIRHAYKRFIEIVLKAKEDAHQTEDKVYYGYKCRNMGLLMTMDEFSYEQIATHFLSPIAKCYLEKVYQEQLEKDLGKRAFKFATQYAPHFPDLIKYADKQFVAYRSLCPGQNMLKTLTELYDFNQKFKLVFDKVSRLTDDEIEMESLRHYYPYLVSKQRMFVADFIKENKHAPMFFLLLHYLRLSEKRSDKIYCLHHGIFDGKSRTLDEVADVMNLTRERVRQIANGKTDVQESPLAYNEDWKYYKKLLTLPFIFEKTDDFVRLNETERLSVDFGVFASLVRLKTNFKEKIVEGHTFLVNNSRKGIALSKCLDTVRSIVKTKYSHDTYVSINDIVSSLPESFGIEIKNIIKFVSTEIYKVQITDDEQLYLPQNYIDIPEELFDILAKNGKPMHVTDIFNAFKARYPESKYTDPQQIKTFLFKHDHIKSIGMTSCYALDSWEGVYFGSIRELLVDLLSVSDVPLHIDKLLKGVRKHFPRTTKSSLAATMGNDSFQRFVEFEGGFYGLASKKYPEEYVVETGQRFSFEERLQSFKDFVETYHRFPGNDGSGLEASLMKWFYRINAGSRSITEEQRMKLDDLCKRFDDLGYPRTATENDFLMKCQNMKDYICQNHSLPSNNNAPEMYGWFRRSYDNYDSFTDKRRRYMTELINYILSLGFSV